MKIVCIMGTYIRQISHIVFHFKFVWATEFFGVSAASYMVVRPSCQLRLRPCKVGLWVSATARRSVHTYLCLLSVSSQPDHNTKQLLHLLWTVLGLLHSLPVLEMLDDLTVANARVRNLGKCHHLPQRHSVRPLQEIQMSSNALYGWNLPTTSDMVVNRKSVRLSGAIHFIGSSLLLPTR